ncbi:GNAT family N-acetyltransferase [Gryllotalpicola sp.]|uniref:GNAT family N-acetyltransferase n=1 Tax=Gryllotalpicola sp. TaxID=1932787 RepID=UPI002634F7CE|nr:GNAT family N-acetyltransferase [Gryllotalpicola sp.]
MSIEVKPADAVPFDDVQKMFVGPGDQAWCQCQWFTVPRAMNRTLTTDDRRERLHEQTRHGNGRGVATTGLVAFVDGEPAGWVAVQPRVDYDNLVRARIPWAERTEDKSDPGVWAITCFITHREFRRQGVSAALASAAAEWAHHNGATAVEGYPVDLSSGRKTSADAMYVGASTAFAAAGFTAVSHPSPGRVVMRIDF